MIKKALLLASVLCVLNQTPVKAETYVEPYSHVTIEITEDYASSNDSFGSIELNGKYIQLPCKASLIFDLGFAPEEDMQAPSRSVVDWFHAYDSQGRAITMDMYNPKDTSVDLDYSIMGVSGDTSPANLSTLLGEPSNKNTYSGVTDISWESGKQERSVDIRYEAGVTGGICRVLWRHRRQKRTQEILNTPLDELADSVLKKYGEEDDE